MSPTTQTHAPSPTSAVPRPPSHVVDDDYVEGITESLFTLSHYHIPEMQAPSTVDSQKASNFSLPFHTTSRFFTRDTRLHLETCANQLQKVLSVAHLFH
jgi:hypothetical protein